MKTSEITDYLVYELLDDDSSATPSIEEAAGAFSRGSEVYTRHEIRTEIDLRVSISTTILVKW